MRGFSSHQQSTYTLQRSSTSQNNNTKMVPQTNILLVILSAVAIGGGHAFSVDASSAAFSCRHHRPLLGSAIASARWPSSVLPPNSYSSTILFGTVRPDTTEFIAEALRLSKEYGTLSNEARLAWDVVEEMDSNDSSSAFHQAATTATTSTSATSNDKRSQEYHDHIRSLSYLLNESQMKLSQIKQLIFRIKEMELNDPTLAHLSDDGDDRNALLMAALADAKATVEVHGPSSVEAREAWNKLDSCFGANYDGIMELDDQCDTDDHRTTTTTTRMSEGVGKQQQQHRPLSLFADRYSAAALKHHHQYNVALDIELLEESIDAMNVIEGLARYVSVEKWRLDAKEEEEEKELGP